MPKISMSSRKVELPDDFLIRRHYPERVEFWLSERNGELILNPCKPDIYKLYLEPTTFCNLRCRTCIRNSWGMPTENMSTSTFQRILESLPDLPYLNQVVFSGFGEPLTHPNFLAMVGAVRKLGLRVSISTNGLLLDRHITEELVRLGVERVNVSVDGANPQTYQDIRGACLQQITENVRQFNEVKQHLHSLRPSLGIEFVAMRSNVAEIKDLVKLGAQWNVSHLLVSNVLPYTEDMRSEVLYSYLPVDPYKTSGWPLKLDAWILWATEDLPRMHWGAARRCRFVGDHGVVIGWDGSVAPCYPLSHDYSYFTIDGRKKQVSRYSLGNVNDQPLAGIWMTEEYTRFRSDVKAYHFPSCPDCDLRDTCDLRENNEGCWGWNPSCADCLWSQDIIRCP